MTTPRMTTKRPARKVQSSALSGAIALLLVWLLQAYGGVAVPTEVGMALTVIVSTLTGYLVPPAAQDTITSP